MSNFVFPSNTILSCLFFFILIIDLYYLIPAVIAQILNHTAELAVLTRTQTNNANAKIETHSVIFKAKISQSSTQFK